VYARLPSTSSSFLLVFLLLCGPFFFFQVRRGDLLSLIVGLLLNFFLVFVCLSDGGVNLGSPTLFPRPPFPWFFLQEF